ncbi:NAD(P)/FAD-dependent oxidoreductase [Gordonia sp. TBRC 11910]|uniref:NAD(P)/FAD-dependent oxidoreductase n=2 Tax=Gordonia asplenii TaxID=2725283 RepID=A0A848KX02_9ACTN|nr:NAD(P)/FAD-dependent oxidoreductase [Gordonia asplenii]
MYTADEFDVVIVGAGISGIAAAVQLQQNCPAKSFTVLEARDAVGGTWDLFRYPGIRSDSDMFTLGYGFNPWTAPEAIAAGGAIKEYLRETTERFGIDRHIRFGSRLAAASFDSADDQWKLTVETADGIQVLRARFVYLGTGYYSYRGGFNPTLTGEDTFAGRLIHPQHWPADLDYAGKNIAVVGSGATSITLVPNLARDAAKVTMIQRSPSYVFVEDGIDVEADDLRRELGPEVAFTRIRLRNLANQQETYAQARQQPEAFKKLLFEAIDEVVGEDVRKRHFTPTYEPWDQRVCVVPDADLFHAIDDGRAAVATGEIARITPTGVEMWDGEHIDADIIVKATGLNVVMGGEAVFDVDGVPVDIGQCWTYKGLAYSGVPNLVYAFGFINASWTLRIEAVNEYWCRILQHMDDVGATRVTPRLTDEPPALPYVTGVSSGYLQRAQAHLPHQGDTAPWINPQRYADTTELLVSVDDGVLHYENLG